MHLVDLHSTVYYYLSFMCLHLYTNRQYNCFNLRAFSQLIFDSNLLDVLN